MTTLRIYPAGKPLTGSIPVPSDKSIGHRAILFGSICEGESRIRNFSYGEDNVSTANALRALGVRIVDVGANELRVHGVGLHGFTPPNAPLDCGNSGTTMRLFSGLLAWCPFNSTMIGDESLSGRPMMRVLRPLRQRGAVVTGKPHPKKEGDVTAPIIIGPLPPSQPLQGIEWDSPVASAQVKSALLLSGLYAHGPTVVREPSTSRDHTERMMVALGVPLRAVGSIVMLDPAGWSGRMPALDVELPGDLSAAAFMVTAAAIVKGSQVTIRDVGVNPTRTGFLEIARDMGLSLSVMTSGDRAGEPVADITAAETRLIGRKVGGETVARAIDEIPIACALAARANGVTRISDAEELRVKESDRIAMMRDVLRAFGVKCEEHTSGLEIEGTDRPLTPAEVESGGDHRIAMTASILALTASGPSLVRNAGCIATSYPKFVATLRALGARVEVES